MCGWFVLLQAPFTSWIICPSFKRCPLRWQCPVSNATTHLNWSLFSLNRSFVRLAEGPDINPFACLSPVVDSQYFIWFLSVQSLTSFLATPIEMPQAGSDPSCYCYSNLYKYVGPRGLSVHSADLCVSSSKVQISSSRRCKGKKWNPRA
jgi:hypothetical protein